MHLRVASLSLIIAVAATIVMSTEASATEALATWTCKATSTTGKHWGRSWNFDSKKAASQRAMRECREHGGGCRVTSCQKKAWSAQREYLTHPDNDKKKIELFWSKPAGPGPWPAVVFIHGHQIRNRTGGMADVKRGYLRRMVKRGFVAVALSQSGYGNSSGPPDFAGPFSQSAVLKAIEFLRAKPFVKPEKIGLVGISRGAILAGMVATKDPRLAAVVLISGIYDQKKGYPAFRCRAGVLVEKESGTSQAAFRARSAMRHSDMIRMPVLLLHGDDDWFDFQLVKRFAETLKANGTWVRLKVFADTGHLIPRDKRFKEIYPFLEWHLRLDIGQWLKKLGLLKYSKRFAENEVDLEVLPDLTEQDLKDLAIPLGHRKKLLKAIAKLQKPQILTPRPIKKILRTKGLVEPRIDYAGLIGRWDGNFVGKTLKNRVTWKSKLTLDVFKNGCGRFSFAKKPRLFGDTSVKIESGVVILRIESRSREFVYTQKDGLATLSATYKGRFEGHPRKKYIRLKKRVAPSREYTPLIGWWEGEFVSKNLKNQVTSESKLTLDVWKHGIGRFSLVKGSRIWETRVKIKHGVVNLVINKRPREFIYTLKNGTATLSATYKFKFAGKSRIRYITLKKRVAPSQQ